MPSLVDRPTVLEHKYLTRSKARAARAMIATQASHPGFIVQNLRREERALIRDFWAADDARARCEIHGALTRARQMILEMIGYPRRPTAKAPPSDPIKRAAAAAVLELDVTSQMDSMDSKSPTQESK